jgi:hypothetical protein
MDYNDKHVNVAKGIEAAADQVDAIDSETRARLDKSITRKFDMRVLPLCTLMHLCSMIDRSNMGMQLTSGPGITSEKVCWSS